MLLVGGDLPQAGCEGCWLVVRGDVKAAKFHFADIQKPPVRQAVQHCLIQTLQVQIQKSKSAQYIGTSNTMFEYYVRQR